MQPENFLGLPDNLSRFDQAQVVILPIPLELTVSYGLGTADGPAGILAASQEVEMYDRELDREPVTEWGIHTLPALALPNEPAAAVDTITSAVEKLAATGKLVVGLGGEHTVSVGFGRGLLAALDGPVTVVQIDAHCDLRDEFEGSPYSHACVARRLLEDDRIEQVLQLGIRSVVAEEVHFARANPERVRIWYAEDVHAGDWQAEFLSRLAGRRVFLTIDVDGMDPAIVPATGTPEPDGLSWRETLEIIRLLTANAQVIGLDCVELAPIPGFHAADFAVAKLLYKTITYVMERRGG